jgi:hypothetical protein
MDIKGELWSSSSRPPNKCQIKGKTKNFTKDSVIIPQKYNIGEVNTISIIQIYNSNMHFFPGEYTW